MAITFVGTATYQSLPSTDTTTSISGTPPAGTQAGDYLIAVLVHHALTVPATPSGWTLGKGQTGSAQTGQAIFYQKLAGAAASSYTFTKATAQASLVIAAVRGVDPTTPLDAAGTGATSAAATSIVHPTATTVASNVMTIMAGAQNTADGTMVTFPGSMTVLAGSTAGTGKRLTVAYEEFPTAGAIGTRTLSSPTSSAWGTSRIHLVPDATAPAAALSGTGTLSAGQAPAVSQTAALGGSGTLGATQTASVARAAALAGSGTLTAVSSPSVPVAAALSGAGTLAAASTPAVSRAAALSGSGALSGSTVGFVSAALSGSGALTAGQMVALIRAAALSGSGTLTAGQMFAVAQAAALSGSGALSGIPVPNFIRAAALSGEGSLLAKAVFRVSWWTGTAWARLVPKVWTGTRWDNVTVTVTQD